MGARCSAASNSRPHRFYGLGVRRFLVLLAAGFLVLLMAGQALAALRTPVLSASNVTPTSIHLSWRDGGTEAGYWVRRKPPGGVYTTIATLGANVRVYDVTNLTPATSYVFRVVAFSGSQRRASNQVPVTTLEVIGNPTPLNPNYNTSPGETLINPIIDCNANPVAGTTGPSGIIVDDSDVTILNPEIRECQQGIVVQKNGSVIPTNVRILANAAYFGYSTTNISLNRSGINWQAGTGEIGDVSVPAAQVGGALDFIDDFRYIRGTTTSGLHVHHIFMDCVACPVFSGQSVGGAKFGIKFLANRVSGGAPYEFSNVEIDHVSLQQFNEEGLSFDDNMGGGTPATDAARFIACDGLVTSVDPVADTVSYSTNCSLVENFANEWVTVNEGTARGTTLKIVSGNGSPLTVADPDNVLASVAAGVHISIGMRSYHNSWHDNVIDETNAHLAGDFNGVTYSRIWNNTVTGVPNFTPSTTWHTRPGATQCFLVNSFNRADAGEDHPEYSFNNSVVGNSCASGDNSAITFKVICASCTPPSYVVTDVPVWMQGNTYGGTFQDWRYQTIQPPSDPTL